MTSGTAEIGYTLKAAEDDESATTEFSFSAEDITAGTASQDLGISITWDSSQAAGTYTDTITYTGAVQDAGTGTTENVVTLTSETGDYEAQDGDILTGTGGANTHITVAAGATITLRNVTITSISTSNNWAGITPLGDATIILEGTNEIKGGYGDYSGIFAAVGGILTIKGSGSLTASSNGFAAGIGSGFNNTLSCGNIEIQGGTITASGGQNSAGIGSSAYASCGNITISGGTITATGNYYAAGIGSSFSASCGYITITSGVTSVTATKGSSSPNSIGAGNSGTCGTVTIADESKVTQN